MAGGPARNRVTPLGDIVAVPGRGSWMGNRGRLHEGRGTRDIVRSYRGKMWIIALRDIGAGEELTYDYNLYDGEDDAPCLCGSKKCRGSLYSAAHLRKIAKKRAKAAAAMAS